MISYLRGKVEIIGDRYLVIDVGGVGLKVFVPASVLQNISRYDHVKLCTHLEVGESAFSLYGFENYEDIEMFQKLLLVSGVGSKVAFNILSSTPSSKLKLAIWEENLSFFKNISGVGKKIAQRIILELKDKIKREEKDILPSDGAEKDLWQDGVSALLSLSYTREEAQEAINFARENLKAPPNLEGLVKFALTYLGKKRL